MAWIESHQQLERHPKTHELMGLMGWDLDATIGKRMRGWWGKWMEVANDAF